MIGTSSRQELRPGVGRQHGVALLEVLIAMLVLGIGVVALAKFQGVALKEGGSARTRALASELAREKLDDLRNFGQLAAGGNGVFGYDEIGSNAGGGENADGSLRLASGNLTLSDVTYNRTWTSTSYYYCASGAAPSTTNCSGAAAKSRPDFKKVVVAVTWTDATGSASLSLEDTFNATEPVLGASALISGTSASGPVVKYTAGLAPQVIAIDIGGDQKKETTSPTPTITRKNQNSPIINTIARYETIRYSTANNTITREEFITLNCVCEQAGTGPGYNLSGQLINKRIGRPRSDAQTPQASECQICCRDHHDDASCGTTDVGKKACYDPYRPADLYMSSGGDHHHYNASGQIADEVNAEYREACRLKRVNGLLQVAQDWNLATLSQVPEAFFAPGGTVSEENISSYGDYILDYVAALLSGGTLPTVVWPDSATVAKGGSAQFQARGLYLEYLTSAEKQAYATRIASGEETVFQEIPFYEVNLTKLAQWSTADPTIATVSNDAVVTETAGQSLYSRGLARGIKAGVTSLTAKASVSNTGVISEAVTTDPHDGSVFQSAVSQITVPGALVTVSGLVTGLPTTTSVAITAVGSGSNPDVICSYTSSSGTFSCSLPAGWSGSLTPVAEGYGFSPPVVDLLDQQADRGSIAFAGTAANAISYSISGTISPAISGGAVAGVGTGGSTNIDCDYTAATGAFDCTVPQGWSGTIVPSGSGYTFTPGSFAVNNVTSNQTVSFAATTGSASTYTISGTIIAPPTTTTPAVTANGSSSIQCSYTPGSGAYSCVVPSGWTGTVTPSAGAGISFRPTSYSFSGGVAANVASQDFNTDYAISGSITVSGSTTILSGVTLSPVTTGGSNTPSCSYNGSAGTYRCIVPGQWYGSITPAKSGYSFSPPNSTHSNVTSPATVNHIATSGAATTYTITVDVSPLSNSGVTRLSVAATAGGVCGAPSQLSGSGTNRTARVLCQVPSGWSGVLTPGITFSNGNRAIFNPASRSFTNITANQSTTFSCTSNC